MKHKEYDLTSPLVCEGIIGDGCGGGRIFYVADEKLQVFDPITKESMVLLNEVKNVQKISKKGCIISLHSKENSIDFNLSNMKN
ncbi:thiamine biosynthesis protein ThiF [Sulfurimonas sp.]|uniref:thiamine biosynthesis protein ThiF n=1 Tax=Sulfurimonas sp. TaxID=2022749 RepID=UPI00260374E5|nr:thiamine biosynthesis protein ThiF [Sulfurimonas sp.]